MKRYWHKGFPEGILLLFNIRTHTNNQRFKNAFVFGSNHFKKITLFVERGSLNHWGQDKTYMELLSCVKSSSYLCDLVLGEVPQLAKYEWELSRHPGYNTKTLTLAHAGLDPRMLAYFQYIYQK